MSEPNGFSQALALFSPIHKDGYKFVAAAAAATVVAFLIATILGLIFVFVTAALVFFFRDPERMVPARDGLVLAPADGSIISVGTVTPPSELGLGSDPMTRISIFLTVLDVHVIRTPVAGRIEASVYRPGQFLNAASPDAPALNEYQGFVIETKDAQHIGSVLIAGTVARRIVPEAGQGDSVTAGPAGGDHPVRQPRGYLPSALGLRFGWRRTADACGRDRSRGLGVAGAQPHFPAHLAGLSLRFHSKRKGSKAETEGSLNVRSRHVRSEKAPERAMSTMFFRNLCHLLRGRSS